MTANNKLRAPHKFVLVLNVCVVVGILNSFLPQRPRGSRWWCAAAGGGPGWMGGSNGRPQGTRTTTDATICSPVVCTAPLSGRVGGEKKHGSSHEAIAQLFLAQARCVMHCLSPKHKHQENL